MALSCAPSTAYELKAHPRIFVTPSGAKVLASHAEGPLRMTYQEIKAAADNALAKGIQQSPRGSDTPWALLALGIAHIVEGAAGRDGKVYADAVKAFWGDGAILSREANGPFGYYAMVYDWIYNSLSPAERIRYGNALGQWLRWYTDTPEITLKGGAWWYNQTWGPATLARAIHATASRRNCWWHSRSPVREQSTNPMHSGSWTRGRSACRRSVFPPLTGWEVSGPRAWATAITGQSR
jgi:hypothetical protein